MTMETWVKGTLKQLFINFQTNAVVSGKTPFFVINPFSTHHTICLNPNQDGLFRGCSRMWGRGGKKALPLQNLSHISYNGEAWHSYTLPKDDPKNV